MDRVIDANAALAISNEHTLKRATKHSKVHALHLFLDYSISDDL